MPPLIGRITLDATRKRLFGGLVIACLVGASAVNGPAAAAGSAATATADVSSAPNATAALADAQRENHRVEISGLDAATSTTYMNPDGTRTTEQSAQPMRTDKNGVLVPVDTSLHLADDGSVRPGATDLAVTLGGGGNTTLATVGLGTGAVTYGWPTALPTPSLDGDTATYADVLPDTDLTVQVGDQTVETSYVLKGQPQAGTQDLFMPVTLNGVTVASDATGALTFHDADTNAVIGQATAATSSDSSADPESDMPTTVQTPSTVTATSGSALPAPQDQPDNGTVVQSTQLPESLLAAPDTQFPVVVDPEVIQAGAESAYTFVNLRYPSQSYFDTAQDSSRVHMGRDPSDSGSLNRALWNFINMGYVADPRNNILSATFSAGLSWTSGCAPQPVDLWYTDPWNSATVWGNQPGASGPWASATPPSANTTNCGAGHSESSVGFNVTALMQNQHTYGHNDASIELRAHDENNSAQWQKWHWNATLSYTYIATPNPVASPTFTSPSEPCVSQAPYPIVNSNYDIVFQGTYSTSDTNSTINAGFIVSNAADSGNSWLWSTNNVNLQNNSSTFTRIVAGQNWLTSGNTYRLQTYAWEPSNYGNFIGTPTYCYFTVDNSSPPTPQLHNPPAGGVINKDPNAPANDLQTGTPLTLTFDVPSGTTAAQNHIVGARWQFGTDLATEPGNAAVGACGSAVTMGTIIKYYGCLTGNQLTITVTPAQEVNRLYVQFLNQANTASLTATIPGGQGGGIEIDAKPNAYGGKQVLGRTTLPWHYWPVTGNPVPDTGSVQDNQRANDVATNLISTSYATAMTPTAGANSPVVPKGNALMFGSAAPSSTHGGTSPMATVATTTSSQPGADINWQTGFTVGAWVNPGAGYGDNWHHAVLSQDGQNDSRFILRESYNGDNGTASRWEFCVTDDASSSAKVDCVDSDPSKDLVKLNTWTFVAGTWDPVGQRITLTTSTPGATSAATATYDAASTSPKTAPTTGGPLVVGRAQFGPFGGSYDGFGGSIADVFLAPVPMTTNQITAQRINSTS